MSSNAPSAFLALFIKSALDKKFDQNLIPFDKRSRIKPKPFLLSKAVAQRCFVKNVFLEISKN